MLRLEVATVMPSSSGLDGPRLFTVITSDTLPLVEGGHYVYYDNDGEVVCQKWKRNFLFSTAKRRKRVIHIIKQ